MCSCSKINKSQHNSIQFNISQDKFSIYFIYIAKHGHLISSIQVTKKKRAHILFKKEDFTLITDDVLEL